MVPFVLEKINSGWLDLYSIASLGYKKEEINNRNVLSAANIKFGYLTMSTSLVFSLFSYITLFFIFRFFL